ncbi:hypothetical protein [Actinophytocola gossypii]|uniref:Uncharacterized protein n=1 Tax=Actinophytocola gossypii TaxID=2812003 RepID=A0ABT2JG65_9PSEU|nr:hypothetical protein [Actinophytocola gossypii]MCT2586843.1 hypothetical protein [Actinophytocola gossypii]
MDPYAAHAVATTRADQFAREADEHRLAKAARESREDERPAAEPVRRPAPARRLGVAR